MTKRVTINVGDKELPCYATMGAMVRYKQLTGREVTQMGSDVSDLCAYLYCCVASACARERIEFSAEFLEFADAVDVEQLNSWATSINDSTGAKKKIPPKKK